jgi:fructokinase
VTTTLGQGRTTIAAVGEVVADAVLPADGIRGHEAHLTVHPGGGSANFSIAVARLGTRCRFAARLSTGSLGQLCKAKLLDSGVDLSASVDVPEPATLAIARLNADGSAAYEFYTEGTADWSWTDDELNALIAEQDGVAPVALHTGTLALALQPSGQVLEALVARAKPAMTISIDPNLRTMLVPLDYYRSRIAAWAGLADILRLSEDDLTQLWPDSSPEAAADRLHEFGTPLAIVSLGADGAFASLRGERIRVPVAGTAVVDTVGAGDSFHGGLLHHLALHGRLGARLDELTVEELTQALTFASRVAAVTVSRPGADPPWAAELE